MIAFFDYRAEYKELKGELERAFSAVMDSGQLILGPQVAAFETEFASYVGAPEAVGVASGTDAIALALRALNVGPGDHVLTVSNAGAPTVAAIRSTGAEPRFVDVRPDSLLLDANALPDALTERTRAIVPVHLYGQPVDLDEVIAFAQKHQLCVVEDCAQAHGATYRRRHVGNFGQIGCFSFYPTKNLGAFGDGGACVCNDRELAERLRSLRMYGFSENDRHCHIEGLNSRLDELQAAFLRVKLPRLDRALSRRRALARRYREGLRGAACRLLEVRPEREHAYHLFVVKTPRRQELCDALRQVRIGFGVHYPMATHLMQAYAFLGYGEGALPVTEQACETVLSLPLYPGLSETDVDRVIEVVREAA